MPKLADDPHAPRRKARWPIVVALVGGVVGLLVIVGWYVLQAQLLPRVERAAQTTLSLNNVKQMVNIHADRAGYRGWPKLTGKAFVLSLIGSGVIDSQSPGNLEIFFSPADEHRGVDRVDPARWQAVTMAALKEGGDFDDLTSYAGPAAVLTSDLLARGARPILADLHLDDVVIVGFANGAVRTMTREDLGLAPGDEWTIGPQSKSEVLRTLSYE